MSQHVLVATQSASMEHVTPSASVNSVNSMAAGSSMLLTPAGSSSVSSPVRSLNESWRRSPRVGKAHQRVVKLVCVVCESESESEQVGERQIERDRERPCRVF